MRLIHLDREPPKLICAQRASESDAYRSGMLSASPGVIFPSHPVPQAWLGRPVLHAGAEQALRRHDNSSMIYQQVARQIAEGLRAIVGHTDGLTEDVTVRLFKHTNNEMKGHVRL